MKLLIVGLVFAGLASMGLVACENNSISTERETIYIAGISDQNKMLSSIKIISSEEIVFSSSLIHLSSSSGKLVATNAQKCIYSGSGNTLTCSEETYRTVMIGSQTWMAENLNYGSYLEDDSSSSQYQVGTQKFCPGNEVSNCDVMGGLYQWHSAMGFTKDCSDGSKICRSQISSGNHQGICPTDWHIPKQVEWEILATFLGEVNVAGKKLKDASLGGSDDYGFSGLGAGYRSDIGGFIPQGKHAFFWSAEVDYWPAEEGSALYSSNSRLNGYYDELYLDEFNTRSRGFSIRCLKD